MKLQINATNIQNSPSGVICVMANQKLSFKVKTLAFGPYFSLLFLAEYGENRSKNHIIKAVTTTAARVAIQTYKHVFEQFAIDTWQPKSKQKIYHFAFKTSITYLNMQYFQEFEKWSWSHRLSSSNWDAGLVKIWCDEVHNFFSFRSDCKTCNSNVNFIIYQITYKITVKLLNCC